MLGGPHGLHVALQLYLNFIRIRGSAACKLSTSRGQYCVVGALMQSHTQKPMLSVWKGCHS